MPEVMSASNCRVCERPTRMQATRLCDRCWEVDARLLNYLAYAGGRRRVMDALLQCAGSAAVADEIGRAARHLADDLADVASRDPLRIRALLERDDTWRDEPHFASLLKRVESIKAVSGWTHSCKSPCRYRGYRFVVDGGSYEVRHAYGVGRTRGACGGELTCRPVGDTAGSGDGDLACHEMDRELAASLAAERPSPDPLVALRCEGCVLPHLQVAYLLATHLVA